MLIKLTRRQLAASSFTADQHFHHSNIIKFQDRPFNDVVHMNTAMVEAWNKKVKPDDVVYHLGDITLNDHTSAINTFALLNGQIKLLENIWHHDKRWLGKRSEMISKSGYPITILPPMVVIETPSTSGWPFVMHLSHYPIGSWDRQHHGSWHLHGHSHTKYIPHAETDLILDIGVDNHPDYAPFSFAEIQEVMYNKGDGTK